MAKDQLFQRDRSEHPKNLIFGLVTSMLLHSFLFVGDNYWHWLQAFAPKRQPELSQPIPIEFVEVPKEEKKPPKETSRRSANDSVAGGEAKLERPISIAKSAPSTAPKAFASSPKDFSAPEPAKPFLPKPQQPTVVSPPDLSPPTKPQPKPRKTAAAPVTPQPTPLPQTTATTPVTSQPTLKPEKIATTPVTPQPTLKPEKIATTSATTRQERLTRQENESRLSQKKFTSEQLETRATPQTQSGTQRSPKPGAASRLGGPISLSSRNLRSDYQAALPNSNRSNRGTAGIDASQDLNLGSYLEQLRQRVRQQWIPGITQSSRRTVIYFTVSRSGQVSRLRVAQTAGSVTDEAALNAIKRAAPFAPLPIAYTGDYIQIQFTFNINVYGDLELWGSG